MCLQGAERARWKMTIHADFFKIVKDACGSAFSAKPPARPDLVFIDGQVKLMKSDQITAWPVFFTVQFFKTIEAGYATGAHTVVLGFDDYEHVPASKGMTQAKRAKHKIKYEFAQSSCLPSAMPEDWGGAMANRTFKVKVVCKVLEVVQAWFARKLEQDAAFRDRRLVLDYRGVPVVLGGASPLHAFVDSQDWSTRTACVGRGECDIKAFTWASASECLCIFSTDGDYLPLALLQTVSERARCKVVLHRMVTQTETPASRKRKSAADDGAAHGERPSSRKRTYEFVCVSTIASWLQTVFPSKSVHPVTQFCALVALCGCDFTRNLPRLGPRTLWKVRHRLQNADLTNPGQIVCALSMAYSDLLVQKNVMPAGVTDSRSFLGAISDASAAAAYEEVMDRIQRDQKVSPKIKEQLWPGARAAAHALNTVWTLHYWTLLHDAPDPHARSFGYARDGKGRTFFVG
jgi:hypothetical protein